MIFNFTRRFYGKKIGNYKIINSLGEGRFGVCFLAKKDNEIVVLKKFKKNIFDWKKRNKTLENQILSRLEHQGIPRLIEVINEINFHGLVLEFKKGETVEMMLFKKKYRFNEIEFYNIGQNLIEIIRYLHESGIVHRDIRIPNVLIHEKKVSLIDFGLARFEDNNRYRKEVDFYFIGSFLLYLLYSGYDGRGKKSQPWYKELALTDEQKIFLKRLLRLKDPYISIVEILNDFQKFFYRGIR